MKPVESSVRDTFRLWIDRYRMLRAAERVGVAVSGGADSMALLDLFQRERSALGIEVEAVHVNHRMRGAQSDADEAFVSDHCNRLDIPLTIRRAQEGWAKHGGNLEARAREMRYALFEEAMRQRSLDKLATGHTLDDQAETVLIRAIRGTSPAGLAGVLPVMDERIVRPLLGVRRSDVLAYCGEREVPFRTDSSNLDTGFLRNRIRLELFPLLVEMNPNAAEALASLADRAAEDEQLVRDLLEPIYQDLVTPESDALCLSRKRLMELSEPQRARILRWAALELAGSPSPLGRTHGRAIETFLQSAGDAGHLDLPRGLALELADRRLILRPKSEDPLPREVAIPGPGIHALPGFNAELRLDPADPPAHPEEVSGRTGEAWIAYVDADRFAFPLAVRSRRDGDRFAPLGMDGSKKLQDFLVDRKIPRYARDRVPLLVGGDMILCVLGHRICRDIRVTQKTKKALRISLIDSG